MMVRSHERKMTSPSDPLELEAHANLPEWLAALGVSLGTALLVVSPFFRLGTASGHDIAFHASSWLDVAEKGRSEEHTSELQSHHDLVCRLLLEKKKNKDQHRLD